MLYIRLPKQNFVWGKSFYNYFICLLLFLNLYRVFNLELQAYDQHLNMILGDVEEIVTTVEIDDETYEEIVRVSYNQQKRKNTYILYFGKAKW